MEEDLPDEPIIDGKPLHYFTQVFSIAGIRPWEYGRIDAGDWAVMLAVISANHAGVTDATESDKVTKMMARPNVGRAG